MYKVFKVGGEYQIFWCPNAPTHFMNKVPYDGKLYSTKAAAYRRVKQLNDELKQRQQEKAKREAQV